MHPAAWVVWAVLSGWLTSCSREAVSPGGSGAPPDASPSGTAAAWRRVLDRVRQRFPEVRQLAIADYVARTAEAGERPMLVDVRPRAEYEVGWIPGAVHIPAGDGFVERFAGVSKDREIVLYCSVGWRSSEAATELQNAGFGHVQNLEGSIFGWANAGRPLANAGGPTRTVHPFDAKWGRLLRPERRAK